MESSYMTVFWLLFDLVVSKKMLDLPSPPDASDLTFAISLLNSNVRCCVILIVIIVAPFPYGSSIYWLSCHCFVLDIISIFCEPSWADILWVIISIFATIVLAILHHLTPISILHWGWDRARTLQFINIISVDAPTALAISVHHCCWVAPSLVEGRIERRRLSTP